jgi:hypothetical protein
VWASWWGAVQIVSPDTVVRWHRRGFALYWRWTSCIRGVGRPAFSADLRALIHTMRVANPAWGAPRIHGELRKLGLEVAQSTVAKYLRRHPKPPSQTWRTFLADHVTQIAAIDFFTVPTATFRLLFVFVVLSRRRGAKRAETRLHHALRRATRLDGAGGLGAIEADGVFGRDRPLLTRSGVAAFGRSLTPT